MYKSTNTSIISSHSGFQPLKEVWLGDSYPEYFYDHLKSSELRELCLYIDELTKIDLKKIQGTIESLGIRVCRPEFESIDGFLDEEDNLLKPPITPRDWAITLGDTLYIIPQFINVEPWKKDIERYQHANQKVQILNRFCETPDDWCYLPFPGIVRCGRDIFIDYDKNCSKQLLAVQNVAKKLAKEYRVHLSTTGDHSDAVFCPVKSKVIVSSHYRSHYDLGWPDWKIISLPDTSAKKTNGWNGNWWVPGVNLTHFNDKMIKTIKNWLGNSSETVFEVNMLVIDEKNVLVLAYDDYICNELEKVGITPHVVDFRCRGFWDGGLHCLTLDIHREGNCIDHWPTRGNNGIDLNA